MAEGQLVVLKSCDSQIEMKVLISTLEAYGIYATDFSHLRDSQLPGDWGGFPVAVIDSDLEAARAILVDIERAATD